MDNLIINWEKILLCEMAEKERLLVYIERLIELKLESESNGIESFRHFLNENSNRFEKAVLGIISEGCMPEVAITIFNNLLSSTKSSNEEYLKKVILVKFALLSQEGNITAQNMKPILQSYLGVELMEYYEI